MIVFAVVAYSVFKLLRAPRNQDGLLWEKEVDRLQADGLGKEIKEEDGKVVVASVSRERSPIVAIEIDHDIAYEDDGKSR